jgi:hypothetical protein
MLKIYIFDILTFNILAFEKLPPFLSLCLSYSCHVFFHNNVLVHVWLHTNIAGNTRDFSNRNTYWKNFCFWKSSLWLPSSQRKKEKEEDKENVDFFIHGIQTTRVLFSTLLTIGTGWEGEKKIVGSTGWNRISTIDANRFNWNSRDRSFTSITSSFVAIMSGWPGGIFAYKVPNLGLFWRALELKMLVYFMAIWYILL